jgi:peptidylglycine monooxygenase
MAEAASHQSDLIVALGSRSYVVRRPWGDLPAGDGRVSDVAVDRNGHVFALLRRDPLSDLPGPSVVELAPDGERLAIWGETLIQDGHMFAFAPDGRLFIIDRDAHQVVICSRDGALLGALGQRGRPGAPFNHPCGVTFSGDRIFVCDGYANSRIHCFAADGSLLHSWGERGVHPGQFVSPHAIASLTGSRLAVCDRYNNRVQIFSEEGKLLDLWTGFYRPTAMAVDDEGNLFVLDQVPSLTIFTPTGEERGRCRPVLTGAHGLTIDRITGTIFLAESGPSRISTLVPV